MVREPKTGPQLSVEGLLVSKCHCLGSNITVFMVAGQAKAGDPPWQAGEWGEGEHQGITVVYRPRFDQ